MPPVTESGSRADVLRALTQRSSTARRPISRATVAFGGSDRLREGLAWEWEQTTLDPGSWRGQLSAEHSLLVLELDGGAVSGWPPGAVPRDLAAAAGDLEVPTVAWLTGAAPSADDRALEAFDAVLVSDPEVLAEVLRSHPSVEARLLLPAVAVRRHSPVRSPGQQRPADVLVRSESGPAGAPDDESAAADTVARSSLTLHRWDHSRSSTPGPAEALSSAYQVFLDVGRRAPGATWPVLEALASRTAVVTVPERAARLPGDLKEVVAVAEPHDLRRHASVLAHQPEYRDRVTHLAHRAVLAGHSFTDRARTILSAGGRHVSPAARTVSIVVPTNRPHELRNVVENVGRQRGVDTELVLVAHGIDVDEADLRSRGLDLGIREVTVVRAGAELTLGAVLNRGLEVASGAYVAKMDDDNYYGAHFLDDLVDTFAYTSAGIAGKWAHYVWLRTSNAVVLRFENYEHAYHRLVQGGSIVAQRDVAHDIRFSNIPRAVDSDFLNRAMAAGVQTYSGDRYNYVSIRGDDRLSHTWKIDDLAFMAGSGRVVTYGDPRDLVSL